MRHAVFAALTLAAIAAAAVVSVSHGEYFRPYFAGLSPVLAITLAACIGFGSLRFLWHAGFEIVARDKMRQGIGRGALLATLFAAFIILVDITAGFPQKLNVPLPAALLFYPAMAYVVETALHAFPLALVLFLLGKPGRNWALWIGLVVAALPEAVFQMAGTVPGKSFSWLDGLVGLHVFAFGLVEMALFRRYDFVSMLSFRLVYYLYWHVLWGALRLQWLF